MKSKKLISFLCAAAMTVSSFASLAVTASAADGDPLFSNSFNKSATGIIVDGNDVASQVDDNNVVPGLKFVTGSRADRATYTDDGGNLIRSGSYYSIEEEDATNKYLRLSFPSFGDFEGTSGYRWAHVTLGDGTYAATATEDLVMDFKVKYTAPLTKGEINTDNSPVLRIGTFDTTAHTATAIKLEADAVGYDAWKQARVVVNNSTGAKLYIDGTEVTGAAASDVKTLADIGLYSASGTYNGQAVADYYKNSNVTDWETYFVAGKPTKTPIADIDNLVIYKAAAGSVNGSTATKTPEDVQGGSSTQATAPPAPETVAGAAPTLTAPDGVQNLLTADFNSDSASIAVQDGGATASIAGGKINLATGGRSDGDDPGAPSTVSVADVTGGSKALKLVGGKYATGGRSPRMYLADSAVGEGETAVMGFSVYTSHTKNEGTPSFWLVDTNEVNPDIVYDSEKKNYGKYSDTSATAAAYWKGVLGFFTSENFEEGAYNFGGSKNRGITLTPGEWHTVVVVVSGDGTYRLFVDGQYKDESGRLAPKVNDTVVSYGQDSAYSIKGLPVIAIENVGSSQPLKNSVALIDNLVAYKLPADATFTDDKYLPKVGTPATPDPNATPTPAPATPTPVKNATITWDNTAKKAVVTSTETTAYDAVVIHAAYDTDGNLYSLKSYPATGISAAAAKDVPFDANDTVYAGDKIMVWDSLEGMIPYAVTVVAAGQGEAANTPAPRPTVAPTEVPTTAPTTGATTAPTTGATTAPTTGATTAPTTGATTAPTTAATTAPTTAATTAPTTAATTAPTEAPTPAPKYTVSGTVDANVDTVKLTPAEGDAITGKIEGTETKTVTFANVPAGTYTIEVTAKSGYEVDTIKVANADATTVTVTDANVTTLAITTKAEAVIPYADGTLTFDGASDAAAYKSYSRVNSTVETATVAGNTTKVNKIAISEAGQSGAGYEKYSNAFKAKGDAVAVSFDITKLGANSYVSVRATKGDNSARNNNADNRFFSIGREGSSDKTLKVWGAEAISVPNTDVEANWYHVDAVINNTANTVALKIYDYKANNNYTNETPLYKNDALAFRDAAADGVVGMDFAGTTGASSAEIDNIYFNDPTYVAPIEVTAANATVDKTQVVAGDVITITPTVPADKKLVAVKVNGSTESITTEQVTTGEAPNTVTKTVYKYTVTGNEEAIAVTAELARADVTAVEIASANKMVEKGKTGTYTATVKAGTAVLADQTITWDVVVPTAEQLESGETAAASKAAGTTISDGTLTVAADQAEGVLLVTASVIKDATAAAGAENTVVGTFKVTIVGEPVYQLVAATDMVNGGVSFKVGEDAVTSVKQSETVEIVPAPAAGYSTTKVEYIKTADLTLETPVWTTVTATSDKYTVAGTALSGDITVKVTYTAIPYTITNANAEADSNGNSIAIKVGDAAATTATVGQDVVIVPTLGEGYKIKTLTYTEAGEGKTPVTITGKTFKMPAANVTVNAVFEAWDGMYFTDSFDEVTMGKEWNDNPRYDNTSIPNVTVNYNNRLKLKTLETQTAGAYTFNKAIMFASNYSRDTRYLTYTIDSKGLGGEGENVKFSMVAALSQSTSGTTGAPTIELKDTAGTKILDISCNGEMSAVKINGEAIPAYNADSAPNGYSMETAATNWNGGQKCALAWKIEVTVDFTAKTSTIKVTEIDTNRVLYEKTAATTATNVSAIGMNVEHWGGVLFDDIMVTAPWYTAPVTPVTPEA